MRDYLKMCMHFKNLLIIITASPTELQLFIDETNMHTRTNKLLG
jgi:hypothetical protein